jgi:hypothetical protein
LLVSLRLSATAARMRSFKAASSILSTGTNLQMLNNIYLFAEEPLPLHWNERIYKAIDAWRAETGLDANSQFLIGPLPPRARRIRAVLDALMRQPTLRPEMFHTLYQFAKEQN